MDPSMIERKNLWTKKKNPANKGASFGEKGLVGKRDFNEREN